MIESIQLGSQRERRMLHHGAGFKNHGFKNHGFQTNHGFQNHGF